MKVFGAICNLRSLHSLYQARRSARKSRKKRPARVELTITALGGECLGAVYVVVGCVFTVTVASRTGARVSATSDEIRVCRRNTYTGTQPD